MGQVGGLPAPEQRQLALTNTPGQLAWQAPPAQGKQSLRSTAPFI